MFHTSFPQSDKSAATRNNKYDNELQNENSLQASEAKVQPLIMCWFPWLCEQRGLFKNVLKKIKIKISQIIKANDVANNVTA